MNKKLKYTLAFLTGTLPILMGYEEGFKTGRVVGYKAHEFSSELDEDLKDFYHNLYKDAHDPKLKGLFKDDYLKSISNSYTFFSKRTKEVVIVDPFKYDSDYDFVKDCMQYRKSDDYYMIRVSR